MSDEEVKVEGEEMPIDAEMLVEHKEEEMPAEESHDEAVA